MKEQTLMTTEENENDLNFSGRESNKELSNFRLWGKSKHQQYYTPNDLADVIFEMLRPLSEESKLKDLSILDPTCGSGRLLLPWKKAGAQVIGIELDKEAAIVAKRLIGKKSVRVGDLLDYADYLEGFNIAVSNPPYGIQWNVKDRNFRSISFESTSYGGSIESQAATIEIITKALDWNGIFVTIIPSSTFENAKDSKLRNHIYSNYNILLRATLDNIFKEEYGINVQVDLVVAQASYETSNDDYAKLELDPTKDINWKEKLISIMHEIIHENEIKIYQYGKNKVHVPFLNNLELIPIIDNVNITPRGVTGHVSALALLDFNNEVFKEYNPIQGIPTGIVDAFLSPPALMKRGIEPAREMLEQIGFVPEVKEKDLIKFEQLKRKYDFECIPLYRPKPHQLLAYFFEQEYTAKKTVKDENGIIFKKGKKYLIHPSWIRNRETVDIQEAYDEGKRRYVTIKTDVDRGYLSIAVQTEQGERTYNEIDVDEIEVFTRAFELPKIEDINDKHPVKVEHMRIRIRKHFPFLFDYQQEDLARFAMKPFGYLGYDMGGGKTVCAASWAKLRNYKNVLVVCQAGLVNNWMNELEKFGFKASRLTTHSTIDKLQHQKRNGEKNEETIFYVTSYEFLSLDTGKVFGPWDCIEYDKDGNERRSSKGNTSEKCPLCHKDHSTVVRECPKCNEHGLWTGNVCLKCGYRSYSYTSKKRIYPAYKRIKKLFGAVIVDEAQMAKSKNTCRGRAVRAMKCKGKLLLTGTLMKGYVHDIYWNVGWLLGYNNPLFHYPYRGGSKQFLNEFGTYEYVTRQFEDTLHEGRGKLIPEVSNLNRFWRIMASFTIRRLKDTMIELPEKHRNVLLLPMDSIHEELYNRYQVWAQDVIGNALRMAEQNGTEVNMGLISSALWKLRFAATVPNASHYLCKPPGPQKALQNGNYWNKINKIVELTKEIQSKNEKVIIFSGLRPMVSAIAKALKKYRISFIPIIASNKTSERFEMIEKFSNDESVTAIVAGLNVLNRGFTITAANNVIITDIEYSPESVLQAEDRAHRTGQEKEVNIYYLFSSGSVDEVMFELVSKKQAAISNAIDAKAVHTDVSKLLESISSNIQLEVAKRITEQETKVIKVEKEPELEPIPEGYDVSVSIPEPAGNPDIFETLYQMKMEMKNRRKKEPKISENQLALF